MFPSNISSHNTLHWKEFWDKPLIIPKTPPSTVLTWFDWFWLLITPFSRQTLLMARKCSRVLSPDRNRAWKIMSEDSALPLAAVGWGNGLLQCSAGRWLYQKSSTNGESLEVFLLLQWKSLCWWWLTFQRSPSRNCLFPIDGFRP